MTILKTIPSSKTCYLQGPLEIYTLTQLPRHVLESCWLLLFDAAISVQMQQIEWPSISINLHIDSHAMSCCLVRPLREATGSELLRYSLPGQAFFRAHQQSRLPVEGLWCLCANRPGWTGQGFCPLCTGGTGGTSSRLTERPHRRGRRMAPLGSVLRSSGLHYVGS